MGRAVVLVLVAVSVATSSSCSHAPAQPSAPVTPAPGAIGSDVFAAAEAWLALLDDREYAESWTVASALVRDRIARDQWIRLIADVRGGLGRVRGRNLSTTDYAAFEGRPAVILVWKSDFETLSTAIEQVTMVLDQGAWRGAEYFVRRR